MNSQNSIMPENYEEFISLTLRTRNSDEFYAPLQQSGTVLNSSKHDTRHITQVMQMNWNVMVSARNQKQMSRS